MPRWFWLWCPNWLEMLWLGAPLRPGPSARLSLSLWRRWRPERVFMIVGDVYADESGTHADSPYMIMGALVARVGQWQDYDKRFLRLLNRNSLTYFHGVELRHNQNEFSGWSDHSKNMLLTDIDKIQNNKTLVRFYTIMQKSEYEEFYKSPPGLTRIQHDTQYGVCFRQSLTFAVEMAKTHFGENFILNFILEENNRFEDAHRILKQIKKYVPDMAKHLGTCIPGEKKKYYALQGADAISYAAYQLEGRGVKDNPNLVEFGIDRTLAGARKQVKYGSPLMRLPINEEILTELKQNKITLQNMWKEQGDKARLAYTNKPPDVDEVCC